MVGYNVAKEVLYDIAGMLNAEFHSDEVKMLINGNDVRYNVIGGELAIEVNGKAYYTDEIYSLDCLNIETDTISKAEIEAVRDFASDVCLATLVGVFELNGLIYHAYNYDKLLADDIDIKYDECGIVDLADSRFGYINRVGDATEFFIVGGEVKTRLYDFDIDLGDSDFDFILNEAWEHRIGLEHFDSFIKDINTPLLNGYELGSYKGKAYSLVSKLLEFGYGDGYYTPLTTERNLEAIDMALGYIKKYARDLYKSLCCEVA